MLREILGDYANPTSSNILTLILSLKDLWLQQLTLRCLLNDYSLFPSFLSLLSNWYSVLKKRCLFSPIYLLHYSIIYTNMNSWWLSTLCYMLKFSTIITCSVDQTLWLRPWGTTSSCWRLYCFDKLPAFSWVFSYFGTSSFILRFPCPSTGMNCFLLIPLFLENGV